MSKCPLVRKALSASLVYRHSAAHAPFGCEVTVGQFDRLATDIPNFFLHEPLGSSADEVRIECGWAAGAEVSSAEGLDAAGSRTETSTPGLERQHGLGWKTGGANAPGAALGAGSFGKRA